MVNEVLILGGGLAGGTAAALLARAQVPVRLLEREAQPHHKICGEFLSGEARRDLERIGLDAISLGAASIDRVRLVSGHRQVEAALGFTALGISRKRLDEAVLERAAANGAQIERGVRVSALDGRDIATSVGAMQAERIFLATGKHDVRGAKRRQSMGRNPYMGFKMHWRPCKRTCEAIRGVVELILFDGGYAGIQLIEGDVMNLCLVIRKGRLASMGGGWDGLITQLMASQPGLARRLDDAEALFQQPLAIANLPYGFIAKPDASADSAIYRLGDQAAMTASLTGDGMAAAIRSAHLAAESVIAGAPPASYHKAMDRLVSPQIRRAMLLQRATEFPMAMHAGFTLLRLWPGLLQNLAGATRLAG